MAAIVRVIHFEILYFIVVGETNLGRYVASKGLLALGMIRVHKSLMIFKDLDRLELPPPDLKTWPFLLHRY